MVRSRRWVFFQAKTWVFFKTKATFQEAGYGNAGNHSLTARSGENSGRAKITVQKWKQR